MQPKRSLLHADCARQLGVLADVNRLAVVEMLMDGPKYVWELNADLGLEQSLLSHHLQILRKASLVESTREGKAVRYRLACGVKPAASKAINLGCCVLLLGAGDRLAAPSSPG